eukprot:11547961-Alexandrium_andersonii.AAC.1
MAARASQGHARAAVGQPARPGPGRDPTRKGKPARRARFWARPARSSTTATRTLALQRPRTRGGANSSRPYAGRR